MAESAGAGNEIHASLLHTLYGQHAGGPNDSTPNYSIPEH